MNERIGALSNILRGSIDIVNMLSGPEVGALIELLGVDRGERVELSPLHLSGAKSRFVRERLDHMGSFEERELMAMALGHLLTNMPPRRPEICYTGPTPIGKVRVFESVITEELYRARSRITVIGFHITLGSREFVKALGDASKRGVELMFMIDRLDEKVDFLTWCRSIDPPPTLYTRDRDPCDPMSALHAKCIVIDDRVAIIGSANQTYHGLSGNIELGVVLRDRSSVEDVIETVSEIRKVLRPL